MYLGKTSKHHAKCGASDLAVRVALAGDPLCLGGGKGKPGGRG